MAARLRRLAPALPLLLLGIGCREPAAVAHEFDGPTAFRYLEQQVAHGPRVPGTPGHGRTGDWIDSLLRQRADTVIVQRWTHRTRAGTSLPLRNLLARFNPAATDRILFLAHWDTRPISDGPNARDRSRPVPGANDGASGAAVLLGIADALQRAPPRSGVDLLFVDGEDYGDFSATPEDVLIGSRYFAANLPAGSRPRFAVLLDMIGDKDLRIAKEGNSQIGAPHVVDLVWETARQLGHGRYFVDEIGPTLTDDHTELQKVGIPAIDVIDFDYAPWHTSEDTIDKVSAQSLQVVGDVALALVRRPSR